MSTSDAKTRTALPLRDYTFLGTTQSLCPDCMSVVPAKIIVRGKRVYFRKTCDEHGVREDFVCSDVNYYDQLQYSVPAKLPRVVAIDPVKGCPLDCGLCTEHEQHTCVGLVELTSSCNLSCPMCYASSGPGGNHESVEACKRAIDRLVEVEGHAEVLQLSGGEPTVHPQFREVLEYAVAQPIDYVMINTNGIRFAQDPALLDLVAEHKDRVEIYFQMDGLDDDVFVALRGEPLLEQKRRALDALREKNIHVTLVATLQGGVNEDQIGPLVNFGLEYENVTGLSFQPATYSGRHVLPEELERRITFPDVIKAIAASSVFSESDFMPLPCAHPNCHSLAYAFRGPSGTVPLTKFFDAKKHYDLLANGISFNRPGVRDLIEQYLGRQGCCAGGDCSGNGPDVFQLGESSSNSDSDQTENHEPVLDIEAVLSAFQDQPAAVEFFQRALSQSLSASDVFRITITSFLDVYNFDVRRVMKCCTHNVLPSGHVIPFCAYNVLYREGHVPLPALDR